MEAAKIIQKMGEDLMRGDICVECLPVLKILVPYVIHSFADKLGYTALFSFIDVVIGGAGVMLILHSRNADSFCISWD